MYIDMEVKYGTDVDYKRHVFEKAINVSLKPNSMKLLFKKFLKFETENGGNSRENYVKKRATNYVDSLMNKKNSGKYEEND